MSRGYRSGNHIMRRISITLAVLCVLAALFLVLILNLISINEQNIKVLRIPFSDQVIALEEIPSAEPVEEIQKPEVSEEPTHPAEGTSYEERIERSVLLPYHLMFDAQAVENFLASIAGTNVNTVIIEAKPASGELAFVSSSELALDANPASNEPLLALKSKLTSAGYAVVASVSCFRDNFAPSKNEALGCKTQDGVLWSDSMRYAWMNPYSEDAHVYLITLISDLYRLGFHEILLANLSFPNIGDFERIVYDEGKDTPEEKEARIDQFLFQLAGAFDGETNLALSVRFDGAAGQAKQSFANFFYRIYLPLTPGEDGAAINTAPITEFSSMMDEGTLPYRLVPQYALEERSAMETYNMVVDTATYGTGYCFSSPEAVYDPLLFQ